MNICYNTNFPVYFSSSIPDKKIGTKARYCKLRKRETAIELRIGRRFEKLKNDNAKMPKFSNSFQTRFLQVVTLTK